MPTKADWIEFWREALKIAQDQRDHADAMYTRLVNTANNEGRPSIRLDRIWAGMKLMDDLAAYADQDIAQCKANLRLLRKGKKKAVRS